MRRHYTGCGGSTAALKSTADKVIQHCGCLGLELLFRSEVGTLRFVLCSWSVIAGRFLVFVMIEMLKINITLTYYPSVCAIIHCLNTNTWISFYRFYNQIFLILVEILPLSFTDTSGITIIKRLNRSIR